MNDGSSHAGERVVHRPPVAAPRDDTPRQDFMRGTSEAPRAPESINVREWSQHFGRRPIDAMLSR